ncbi:armadillo-type protein [Mycena crocata]|nr:armadillo-type protein [Mycena crocata]
MPPLTRQPTRQSYLSWWSDSNSLLIGNPIHMPAKPLAKLMYHRDVSNFIKHQRGIPLSEETMEVFLSYLRWKYVADQTKIIILRELDERARIESEARAAVKSLVVYDILLESSNDVKRWFCFVLGRLAFHKSTVGDVLAVEPCASLVTLLRDPDILVVEGAISVLSPFASDPKGAQAVVDANVLNFVHELLKSPHSGVRRDACSMLGSLALYKSTVGAVLAVEPCASLVTLLRDPDILVVEGAISVLSPFTSDPKGAQAVVDTNVLNFVHELLKSPHSGVRRDACSMLGSLALHKSTVGAVLAVQPCASLGTLLRDPDISVVRRTIYALTEFAFDPKRAQAVVRENVLDLLLKSPHSGVRKYAYWTLSRPAFHKSTVGAVLPVQPCASLGTLLRDPDISVVRRTIYALTEFAFDPKRAQAVVRANVLDLLLKSPHSGVRKYAYWTLSRPAFHKSTVGAVLPVQPCASLVTLLRDPDISVVRRTICCGNIPDVVRHHYDPGETA